MAIPRTLAATNGGKGNATISNTENSAAYSNALAFYIPHNATKVICRSRITSKSAVPSIPIAWYGKKTQLGTQYELGGLGTKADLESETNDMMEFEAPLGLDYLYPVISGSDPGGVGETFTVVSCIDIFY